MVNDMTAVVAAASPNRGIGYQGQMVRRIDFFKNRIGFTIHVSYFRNLSKFVDAVIHLAMETPW